MQNRIVVVGGGFSGLWAAIAARRVAGDQMEITLVSRQPILAIRPRMYEAKPETLSVDLPPLLDTAGVRFVREEATGIDPAGKTVMLSGGQTLQYDRLIIATGSQMRRPPVPGAELAFSVDTQTEAIDFDRRLAEIARDVEKPTIAVVGAGFVGIELALELRDRLKEHNDNGVDERAHIVLIERAQAVGPELGEGPRAAIEAAIGEAGIELRLGALVKSLAADIVTFEDGSKIAADAVVLATGMVAAPFVAGVPGDRDVIGRIIVDGDLRAPGAPDIFVTGDAAVADTGNGHMTLQSCQHAGQLGRVAGENAARDLLGQSTVPYEQLRYVTCLDLGRSGAVVTQGWERNIEKTGTEGKAVKQHINTRIIYPPVDATIEQLLAASSINLAERAKTIKI